MSTASHMPIRLMRSVVFTIIDTFDGKGIAESLDRLLKGDAMIAPIGGRFVLLPFEFRHHSTTGYQ
jgi:hypothetical protein